MSKYKGNIVSATQTVLSGTNYTGKANGKFTLSEQIQAKQSSLWAKGLTVPNPPTIGVASFSNAAASVDFTAPAETGGTSILDYTVTSTPGSIQSTGSLPPISVSGLTNGTSYTFKVVARNSQGISLESAASNSAGITVPAAPTIGTAVYGDTSAIVNFTAPSSGGSTILDYTVTSTPGNVTAVGTSTSITVPNLTNGTSYTFKVKARNIVGYGPESAASNSVVPSGATAPAAPSITSFSVNHAAGTVTLNFAAPTDTGGSPITGYTLSINSGTAINISKAVSTYTTGAIGTFDVNLALKAVNIIGPGAAAILNTTVFPAIGSAAGGGYYAGDIQQGGVVYGIIVSPKASGNTGAAYNIGAYGVSLNATDRVNGPANTTSGAAKGATGFTFCNDLVIGTYSDWYMPAIDELEVMFRNLKPSTQTNNTSFGINSNAYPATTSNYTSTVPGQTSITAFRYNNSECLISTTTGAVCSSTEMAPQYMRVINMYTTVADYNGEQAIMSKQSGNAEIKIRAIRRVVKP